MRMMLLAGTAALAAIALPVAAQDTTTDKLPEATVPTAETRPPPDSTMLPETPSQPETPMPPEPMTPPPADAPMPPPPADTPMPPPTADAPMSAPSGAGPAGHDGHFAQFDQNSDGMLTPLEFARMVTAMQAGPQAAAMIAEADKAQTGKNGGNAAVTLINDSMDELGAADTDHDYKVSRSESEVWHAKQ